MDQPSPLWKRTLTAPWRAVAWCGRGLWRRKRPILAALTILVCLHLAATIITGVALRREYARLRKAGEPLTGDQVLTTLQQRVASMEFHPSADQPNAAWVYEHAFQELRLSEAGKRCWEEVARGDVRAGDPRRLRFARSMVPANRRYFSLLEEGSRIRDCAFPVNWYSGAAALFPHLARMREAARFLALRAELATADGDADAALGDCATILRMAEHAKSEPTIIGQLVGYALQGFALTTLEHVLANAEPQAPACTRLSAQLEHTDQIGPSVRAMQGERVLFGRWAFDYLRHKGKDPGLAEVVGKQVLWLRIPARTVGRPVLNVNELTYLRSLTGWTDVMRLPFPEALQREKSLQQDMDALPAYRAVLARMLTPAFARFTWSRNRTTAMIGAAEIALALRLYRVAHGTYPDSLSALENAGWRLPNDPFTEQPYRYRRQGAGFLVYSVGPDLTDDGGKAHQPPVMKQEDKGYDFPLSCPR